MTFGRKDNLARRPVRPDGSFHRSKRRRGLDQPLSGRPASGASIFRSVLRAFATLLKRR